MVKQVYLNLERLEVYVSQEANCEYNFRTARGIEPRMWVSMYSLKGLTARSIVVARELYGGMEDHAPFPLGFTWLPA